MDINEVLLPGVGLRYEFLTRHGDRVGVVALRSGDFEVAVYDAGDPDSPGATFHLTATEADAVAQVLGGPRIAERFADLTREVPGLGAGRLEVLPESPFAGRTLGDTRARTRTGVSVVALVRGDEVIASPGPDQRLEAGDVLVVIGTEQGLAEATGILDRG